MSVSSAVDVMAQLKAMMGDAAETPTKKATKPRIAAETVVQPVVEPAAKEVIPPQSAVTTGGCPVVVLEDGSTFSDMEGCKVCFIAADADDVTADELAAGVSISDLLTLRDALLAIRKILD